MDVKDITKIFIIESPSNDDIEKGWEESKALSQNLKLAGIKNTSFTVSGIESFEESLANISKEVKRDKRDFGAITLHFSMHGTKDGLQFTNDEFLDWKNFYLLIKNFNEYIGYLTFKGKNIPPVNLNFSVCYAFYAIAIKNMGVESPYQMLVAPTSPIHWADSILAFETFYHNSLHLESGVSSAISKMNHVIDLTDVFKIDLMDCLKME